MNWKRTARWSWLILPFLLLALWPGDAAAGHKSRPAPPPCTKLEAGQACLYEVTEEAVFSAFMVLPTGPVPTVREATASLMGRVVGIFPVVCDGGCDIVALASDKVSLLTGAGLPITDCDGKSVCGNFAIVLNQDNPVDPAEVVVGIGTLSGEVNLAPAVVGPDSIPMSGDELPLGSISGTWTAMWVAGGALGGFTTGGSFTGTFRLPFTSEGVLKNLLKGRFHLPHRGIRPAFYLLDSLKKVPVRLDERSLAAPTVRLEVQFSTP